MKNPAAVVRHITKNHVTIAPEIGYSVTVFNVADAHIEAVVASDDGTETIRLLVEAPGPDRTMAIKRHGRIVDILYAQKGPDGTLHA